MIIKRKILGSIALAVILVAALALPAWADGPDFYLEVVGGSSGLTLKPPPGKLFDLQNMNPGDTRTAAIELKNDYSRWYDLSLKAQTPEDGGLLEMLELTVTYKDNNLFSGQLGDFARESISLGRFQPGDQGTLKMEVHLPGPETGNEYQGQGAVVKWVFTAVGEKDEPGPGPDPDPGSDDSDDPDDPVEIRPEDPPAGPVEEPAPKPEEPPLKEVPPEEVPGATPDMPKTGEEAHTHYYLLGGLALLAGTQIAYSRKRS